MNGPDLEALERVLRFMERGGLSEFTWESNGEKIHLRRPDGGDVGRAVPMVQPAPQFFPTFSAPASVAPSTPVDSKHVTVKSPFVGTFYRAPSPTAAVYVEKGQRVEKGQVLCIVEAMKLMNEIESEVSGKIVEIPAASGKPVEFDQVLFVIDPNA